MCSEFSGGEKGAKGSEDKTPYQIGSSTPVREAREEQWHTVSRYDYDIKRSDGRYEIK